MADRVDLGSGSEGAVECGQSAGEGEQRGASRVEARRVVVGCFERERGRRAQTEAILDGGRLLDVAGVAGVDEDAGRHGDIGGVATIDAEVMVAGVVDDLVDVVVLVDDHHGHVSTAVLGHGDRCPSGDVDDGEAVQGVAVHPDHRLVLDGRWRAIVGQHVHAAGVAL